MELSTFDVKVIDVALKYCYDSPDSFTRAFTKFHGITPSLAKHSGAKLKSFAPIKIKQALKGGTLMEYKIVEKSAFTIMGRCRRFNADTSYEEIPKFWGEHFATGGGETVVGMFGACIDGDGKEFDYLIADLYFPWKEVPEGYETRTFEGGTWAVFHYVGECPQALQELNTQIFGEWLPNSKEYELAANYNFEFYISETEGEIWLPVKKK
jgi:AraC family transcriptional regulator